MRLYLLLVLFILSISFSHAQTQDTNYVDGVVHFKLNNSSLLDLDPYQNNVPALNLIFSLYSVDTIFKPFKLPSTDLDKVYRLRFSNFNAVDNIIADLQLIADVEFAEKIPLYKTTATPNDIANEQWYLDKIDTELAWDVTTGSNSVVIAIVDNAVMHSHEDLADNRWVNSAESGGLAGFDDDLNGYVDDIYGYDVADGNGNPEPPGGTDNSSAFIHGTHCAGIATASTNNNKGVAAIGYNCKFLSVKCSPNSSGGQALTNAQDGVFYAMRAGADIISMSFGSSGNALVSQLVINQANSAGIVLIGAAGNDNTSDEFYPGAYPNVIAVGATDQNDQKASFSNYGSWVDVMAPGVSIYSTLPEGGNTYGNRQGTSMATPLVAGLAGLVLSNSPNMSPTQVKSAIQQGCENIDAENPNYLGEIGAGRINAFHTFSPQGDESRGQLSYSIFPNPLSSGQNLHVNFEREENRALIICDMTGKRVLEKSYETSQIQVPTKELPMGCYLIRIQSQEEQLSHKLIITE